MDKRVKRLDRIVTLAELEERHECLELRRVQQSLDQAAHTLEDLLSYRRNYEHGPISFSSVAAVRWQDYRRFLSRLDQAVVSQNELVSSRQQLLRVHQRRWQEKRRRVGVLDEIRQRYLRAAAERDERLMQKALDDLKPMEKIFEA
jgi:flagellar protein FliJ